MKHPLAISIVTALATVTIAGAAPLNPRQISADSNWFLHVDFDGLRTTDTGGELVSQLEEKNGRQFRAIKRMFSLNPLTDLGGVTITGPGEKDVAVVLIEGRFDREHIEDIIAAAKDYDTHTHGEITVHSWTDDKKDKEQFGAFVNQGLIAVSDHEGMLHDTLDVLAGDAPSRKNDPFFKKSGAPAVVAGWAHLAEIEIEDEESQLLRKADELRIAVSENGGKIAARLAVNAPDQATAEQMRRVLDGIAAFAELAEIISEDIVLDVSLDKARQRVEAAVTMPVNEFLSFVEKEGILDEEEENDDDDDK